MHAPRAGPYFLRPRSPLSPLLLDSHAVTRDSRSSIPPQPSSSGSCRLQGLGLVM